MQYFMYNKDELSHNAENTSDVQMIGYGSGVMMRAETFHFVGVGAPLHSHYHEQITYCKSGKLQVINADGSMGKILNPGDAVYFAPNEVHGVRVLEADSMVIDAFTPCRIDHLITHMTGIKKF